MDQKKVHFIFHFFIFFSCLNVIKVMFPTLFLSVRNSSGGGKNSKKEVSDVRFEGVCSPDGYSQALRDEFMVSLKADI